MLRYRHTYILHYKVCRIYNLYVYLAFTNIFNKIITLKQCFIKMGRVRHLVADAV